MTTKTSNEKILDAFIRHQLYVLRYSGGLRNQSLAVLQKTEKSVYNLMLQFMAKAGDDRTLTSRDSKLAQAEVEEGLKEIRYPAWDSITPTIMDEVRAFAVSEAASAAAVIEGATPVILGLSLPPAQQLISVVNSQPFQGRTLKQWMVKNSQDDVQRILSYAKAGIVQGQTPIQVARGIVSSQGPMLNRSVVRKAVRDIESVLLTVTNGVQQEAKQALYRENSDLIDTELFLATLDGRTTFECAGYDTDIFPLGQGPIPPLHFRCRSTRVPYINPDNLGDRPFYAGTEKMLVKEFSEKNGLGKIDSRADLPRGFKTRYDEYVKVRRRELVGNVPARTPFSTWIKGQSVEFQRDWFGPARYELFKKGEISLDRFTDPTGATLTLPELEKKGFLLLS